MTALVFVDTNVLVYARDASEKEKRAAAQDWLQKLWHGGAGRLSAQVLREYYATVTRKLDPGMAPELARADVRDLLAWAPDLSEAAVVERAWHVEEDHSLGWWDALIAAAAMELGCEYLLTEDFSHGRTLDSLKIVSPFRRKPGEVLGV